jgi:short chain dehydrogenase
MTKVVLITGASDGIGLEIARQSVAMGYAVFMLARDPDRLRRAAETVPGEKRPRFVSVDLTDERALDEFFIGMDEAELVPDIRRVMGKAGRTVQAQHAGHLAAEPLGREPHDQARLRRHRQYVVSRGHKALAVVCGLCCQQGFHQQLKSGPACRGQTPRRFRVSHSPAGSAGKLHGKPPQGRFEFNSGLAIIAQRFGIRRGEGGVECGPQRQTLRRLGNGHLGRYGNRRKTPRRVGPHADVDAVQAPPVVGAFGTSGCADASST